MLPHAGIFNHGEGLPPVVFHLQKNALLKQAASVYANKGRSTFPVACFLAFQALLGEQKQPAKPQVVFAWVGGPAADV
jgi:hypothetical protein